MMRSPIPAGLQSLVAQKRMPLGMKMPEEQPLPRGMQALIEAQQVLRQQAAPVTPDGRPTIAGMTEQAINQQAMPQSMPAPNPQVQPQTPGTIAQMAQSAGIAGQQQQAAQQEAMRAAMEMAQQQQQPAQAMAQGGVASLSADNLSQLKYAHGGIIGFNGEDEEGSKVPMPYGEQMLNVLKFFPDVASRLFSTLVSAPETYEEKQKKEEKQKPETKSVAVTPETSEVERLERLHPAPEWNIDTLLGRKPAAPVPAAGQARVTAPAAPGASQAAPAVAPVNPDLERVRNLLEAQFTGTAPTPQGTMQEREEFRKAQGLQGLVGSAVEESIKRAAERSAATEREYEEGKKGRGIEQLIDMLSAGARGPVGSFGAAYTSTTRAQRAADMQFRQLMDASAEKRDQMAASVQAMREAAADQDAAAHRKAVEDYRKAKHDFDTVQRQLAGAALSASTTMQEGALNRAATERLHQIDNQFRLALHQSPAPSLERDIIAAYQKQGLPLPQAYERLMNIKTGDRAEVAHEKNRIARQKLLESDMQYKLLSMQAAGEKDPAKKSQLQAQIDAIEQRAGVIPVGAPAGGGTIRFDASGNPVK